MGPLREKAMLAKSAKHTHVFCQRRNLRYLGCVSLKKGGKKYYTPLPPISVFVRYNFISDLCNLDVLHHSGEFS